MKTLLLTLAVLMSLSSSVYASHRYESNKQHHRVYTDHSYKHKLSDHRHYKPEYKPLRHPYKQHKKSHHQHYHGYRPLFGGLWIFID